VVEKAMHSQLIQHLHTNNILVTAEQYYFRKGISSEDAAFRLTDSVFKSVNKKNSCWRNFLWFGKCFWLCESWNFYS